MTTLKTTNSMYSLVKGFQIDETISDVISENTRKFFKELDTISLNKVTNYCYSNTSDKCCSNDDCYFCTIMDYVHQEFQDWRENNKCSLILHKGKNNYTCYECSGNNKLHYLL